MRYATPIVEKSSSISELGGTGEPVTRSPPESSLQRQRRDLKGQTSGLERDDHHVPPLHCRVFPARSSYRCNLTSFFDAWRPLTRGPMKVNAYGDHTLRSNDPVPPAVAPDGGGAS